MAKCPHRLWDCSVGTGDWVPGAKAAGTWTSPPSSAEFRMSGANIHRPVLPHNLHREILVLLYVMRSWQLFSKSRNFFWCKCTFHGETPLTVARRTNTNGMRGQVQDVSPGNELWRSGKKEIQIDLAPWNHGARSARKMRLQWRRNVGGGGKLKCAMCLFTSAVGV